MRHATIVIGIPLTLLGLVAAGLALPSGGATTAADPESMAMISRSPLGVLSEDEATAAYQGFIRTLSAEKARDFDEILDDYLDRHRQDCIDMAEGRVAYSEGAALARQNRRKLYRRVAELLSPEEHARFVRTIGIQLGWVGSITRAPPLAEQGFQPRPLK